MKKLIALILAALILMVLMTSCLQSNKSVNEEDSDGKISIVATVFPAYDFAREIAGNKANITMLLPPASESHSFEPTPQDIIKIQDCDVFIYVGGESDEWVNSILESMDTDDMKIITLMDCVAAVPEEVVLGMEEEPSEIIESEDAEYDEHVWTAPNNARLIVRKVADTLCEIDKVNAEFYRKNTESYQAKLDELHDKFQAVVDGAVRKTMVFGDRFPFRYLADAYGLSYFAAFPGCSTETEPSAATVKFLIDKVNTEKIPVIFHIELSNKKMANTISESTGAKVLQLHACHNISKSDFESGMSYLEIMEQNVNALKEALN